MSFASDWQRCKKAADIALDVRLPPAAEPPRKLHAAMRYATMNGGKRFRAVLLIMTGEMLNTQTQPLLAPAAAIECVHAYSLVHDDLPCMDDDDYRRGKPACHIEYDEATAILTGDALLTLAFEILAQDQDLVNFDHCKGALIAALAQAAGCRGMAGGQMMDIEYENSGKMAANLNQVHTLKTAKLIQCSVRLGALLSDVSDNEYECLSVYGENLGLAFQYRDDELDEEHQFQQRMRPAELYRDQAIAALANIDRDTTRLKEVARLVVNRET